MLLVSFANGMQFSPVVSAVKFPETVEETSKDEFKLSWLMVYWAQLL